MTIAFPNKGILLEAFSQIDCGIQILLNLAKFSVKFNFIMLKIFSDLMVIIISRKTFNLQFRIPDGDFNLKCCIRTLSITFGVNTLNTLK